MKKLSVPRLEAAVAAWEMLVDYPVPGFIRKCCANRNVTHLELAVGFVAVGILFGVFLALVSGLLSVSWINRYVAAGIFAVAAAAAVEQNDQNDNPPNTAATEAIAVTHNRYLRNSISEHWAHSMVFRRRKKVSADCSHIFPFAA